MDSVITYTNPNRNIVSNGVLGMVFLLATEMMFFSGLISAYIVNRAGSSWPPMGQPRLPIEVTAVNTIILLISAVTVFLARENYLTGNAKLKKKADFLLILTVLLGTVFVLVQGFEWMKLIGFGLTTTSSLYGAFFYTIIGVHAFHVLVGLTLLIYLLISIKTSILDSQTESSKVKVTVCSLYWYFVVGIWPVLYLLVYII